MDARQIPLKSGSQYAQQYDKEQTGDGCKSDMSCLFQTEVGDGTCYGGGCVHVLAENVGNISCKNVSEQTAADTGDNTDKKKKRHTGIAGQLLRTADAVNGKCAKTYRI